MFEYLLARKLFVKGFVNAYDTSVAYCSLKRSGVDLTLVLAKPK